MKRRDFIKRLFGGAALALASLYVPGRPWSMAVPKPPSPQSEFWLAERLAEAIVRREDDCFIRDPLSPGAALQQLG